MCWPLTQAPNAITIVSEQYSQQYTYSYSHIQLHTLEYMRTHPMYIAHVIITKYFLQKCNTHSKRVPHNIRPDQGTKNPILPNDSNQLSLSLPLTTSFSPSLISLILHCSSPHSSVIIKASGSGRHSGPLPLSQRASIPAWYVMICCIEAYPWNVRGAGVCYGMGRRERFPCRYILHIGQLVN